MVIIMTWLTRTHPSTALDYKVESRRYSIEVPEGTDIPTEVLRRTSTWFELPTGSKVKTLGGTRARTREFPRRAMRGAREVNSEWGGK